MTRPRSALLADGAAIRVGDAETEIVRRAGTDERPILRLAAAGTREAILALRGQDLTVARSDAPALGEDEWYAEDLKGCTVVDATAGQEVGVVRDMLALPSCEALIVDRAGDGAELLVPLVGIASARSTSAPGGSTSTSRSSGDTA